MNTWTALCNYGQLLRMIHMLQHDQDRHSLMPRLWLVQLVNAAQYISYLPVWGHTWTGLISGGWNESNETVGSSTVRPKYSVQLPLSNFLNAIVTLTCGRFPAVSHTSLDHSCGYIHWIPRSKIQSSSRKKIRLEHMKAPVLTKQVTDNKDQHEVCDKLATCTSQMLTWPKMVPQASLQLIHQSLKIFKCQSLHQRQHSMPLNMIHNVILSKL